MLTDVNGDGLVDLTLELSVDEMRANGVVDLETLENYFAGQLTDLTDIAGRDATTFIPEPSAFVLISVGLIEVLACRDR